MDQINVPISRNLSLEYLVTGAPSVGDLNLAVELGQKEPDGKRHAEMVLARANEAARNGRCFHNFVERIGFADQEVRSFLKDRSRIIQLTDCDDGILKIAERRVIYEHPEENPSVPVNLERKGRVCPKQALP